MPISRQARWMRSAISPRLAMSIFLNMGASAQSPRRAAPAVQCGCAETPAAFSPRLAIRIFLNIGALFDDEQGLAELDGLAVLAQDARDGAGFVGLDLVHDLHRLDDADRFAFLDGVADLDKRLRARAGGAVERADHRRL